MGSNWSVFDLIVITFYLCVQYLVLSAYIDAHFIVLKQFILILIR